MASARAKFNPTHGFVRRTFACGVLAFAACFTSSASAHPFAIDQANDSIASSFGFVLPFPGNDPLGQEFVPTLTALDVVELRMNDQILGNGLGADVQVQVRDGSILGAILGASGVESVVPSSPISIIHFDFGATVALTPGNTYVIEVLHLSGDAIGVFTTGENANLYAAGDLIRGGVETPAHDLWFREGTQIPAPGTLLLLAVGFLGVYVARRRFR